MTTLKDLAALWEERAKKDTYVDVTVQRLKKRPGARERIAKQIAAGAKIMYSEWKPGDEPGIECANCGAALVVLANNTLGCPSCNATETR